MVHRMSTATAFATPTMVHPSHRLSTATNPRTNLLCKTWKARGLRTASRRVLGPSAAAAAEGAPVVASPAVEAPAATWRIYAGRMPLIGFEAVAGALKNTPLQQLLLLHTFVLLEGQDQVWCFDFLPMRPTSPATALLLLTASTAPGELRAKKLNVTSVKASNSIKLLGSCKHSDALELASQYNRTYDTQLHLLHNNCSHHSSGLTKLLLENSTPPSTTGMKDLQQQQNHA